MAYGICQLIPPNVKGTVEFRLVTPFDQKDVPVCNFQCSYKAGMHAASVIEIARFSRLWKSDAVGVTGYERLVVSFNPLNQLSFYGLLSLRVCGCAGWIIDTEQFQRLP